MKKFIISMGLAATGTAAFQMNCAAQALENTPKDWNVSGALHGFYDDNYSTSPQKHGSYGIEVSPTVSTSVPFRQTEFGFLYSYDLQWYEERSDSGQNPYDQSHTFNLWLDHSFSENLSATVNDNFVVGQEPELLAAGAGGGLATYERLNGNNIANNATVTVKQDWSPSFTTVLTYGNYLALYSNHGAYTNAAGQLTTGSPLAPASGASYAGELNRDQNTVDLEAQWHFGPETFVDAGYQAVLVNYTGDEPIAVYNGALIDSRSRDSVTHIGYVGVQHNLLPNLVAAAKVGVSYYDAYNNHQPGQSNTAVSPYADVSLIYTYLPGDNAQLGFTQQRNPTDVPTLAANGSETLDQDTSSLHASINHHFTPKLMGTVIASWNASTYDGGAYNNDTDDYYALGVSANYVFTRNLSGEVDYNYDHITSSVAGREYVRNRVSIGLSVTY